jgi:hypothetical protein
MDEFRHESTRKTPIPLFLYSVQYPSPEPCGIDIPVLPCGMYKGNHDGDALSQSSKPPSICVPSECTGALLIRRWT